MNPKTFATCLLFFFFASSAFSQQTEYVYYFNADFGICPKSESLFTGRGMIKNNLLNLKVYSNKFPGTPLLVANFTDTTLSEMQGPFKSFYINGTKESERNYENNVLDGAWEKWDSTGHLTDSLNYADGKMTDSSKFYYYKNGAISSFNISDIKNDKFYQKNYNDSGKITSEVFFTGQKGIRKDYKNGIVMVDSLFTREEKEASFPGGLRAWSRYLSAKLTSNIDKFSESDYGTCVVRFIINTDGKVSDVKATTMIGSTLAEFAVDIISHGPKWIPATQYGRLVKAYRLQPVSLGRIR